MPKTTGTNRYSIRDLSSGRYQARWYDDAGERKSKTFTTKTEAKRFLDNIKSDRNRGDYIDPNDAKRQFREVAELWFASRNLRPKTEHAYRTILDHRIYPTFAHRAIGSITTMDLVAWITFLSTEGKRVNHNNKGEPDLANPNTLRDSRRRERLEEARKRSGVAVRPGKPLAPGTVHNAVRVMKQILDAAVRARYLRGNPANGLTRDDMPKHHREEVHYLSARQVERLAGATEKVVAEGDFFSGDAFGMLVRFAAQTGMRSGECCGLRWENVDLLRGRVTVAESISTISASEWYVVAPKNNKTRVVPIAPALVEELKRYAERQSRFTHKDSETGEQRSAFAPGAYVWPSPVASEEAPYGYTPMHWGRDFYLKWWKASVKEAGLPATLTFHALRHTCASLLIAANVPAKAIQAHLGHSSFKITMDTYGHLYADSTDVVTDALNAAFAAPTYPEPSNVRQMWG
ncbi:integrase [Prescottella equi]|nr:integrase [Prescottella equi]